MKAHVFAPSIAKIAEATLKVAFGAWAEKSAAQALGAAVSGTSSELMQAIIPSVAKEVIGGSAAAIAGPLVSVLLRLTDATSAKVDKIVRAPYKTGMREAGRARWWPSRGRRAI